MRRDTHTFKVSGMHCAGCVGKVAAAVAELPRVVRVAGGLEPELARVDFDGARVSPEAIVQAIRGLGYKARGTAPGRGGARPRAGAPAGRAGPLSWAGPSGSSSSR